MEQVALDTARSFFQVTVATRAWNAQHGGVYVPVTDQFPPNPYLEDPRRDVQTTDGLSLTKVNPAYMTRLLGGILEECSGVRIHITSLRPLRPENGPDAWEGASLRAFDAGETEAHAVVDSGASPSYRYMAPLRTEAACLGCHGKHGYREGDVRGGISVSLPYGPYQAVEAAHTRLTSVAHGSFLAVVLGLVAALGTRLARSLRAVDAARAQVRTLEGLLPICMHCKKIRQEGAAAADAQGWVPIEGYIMDRSQAQFSHGLCPECLEIHYPAFGEARKKPGT